MELEMQGLTEDASNLRTWALIYLGTGLHAVQDMYAHTDEHVDSVNFIFFTVYHHLGPKGKDADTAKDQYGPIDRAIAAQNATYDYLNRFIEEVDYH